MKHQKKIGIFPAPKMLRAAEKFVLKLAVFSLVIFKDKRKIAKDEEKKPKKNTKAF